ncbi:MAG: hypothetical protein ACI8S6_003340 [Myxococcota bacterium]|jgi:hypothetical protein
MPSFFRTAEDVRIFFLKETGTKEQKRQYARLKTIFVQSVRRTGARGHFFFHRKCSSLGGAPILIFEPQGPIDHGIFQEGITRFGETLFGTFRCTAPGFIELEVKKNLGTANALKYSRDIRDVVKSFAGVMQTGGDDRVLIVTPKEKARIAREAADQKRAEIVEARERRQQMNEERRLKREVRRQQKKEAAAARGAPSASEQVTAEKKRRAEVKAKGKPKAKKDKDPRRVRREKEEQAASARIARLQKEADAAEADGASFEASAAAEDARDLAAEIADQLRDARAPARSVAQACRGKNAVQVQAALFQLVARGPHKEAAGRLLARVRAAGSAPIEGVLRKWVRDEDGRLAELQALTESAEAEALALEKLASRTEAAAMAAREEAANLKVEELQARLTAAEAVAGDETGLDDLRSAVADAEVARREVEIAARQQDATRALRALQAGLQALEDGDNSDLLRDPKQLRRAVRADPSMRKGLRRLRSAITGLRAVGAPSGAMADVWDEHPDILWAQAAILSAL